VTLTERGGSAVARTITCERDRGGSSYAGANETVAARCERNRGGCQLGAKRRPEQSAPQAHTPAWRGWSGRHGAEPARSRGHGAGQATSRALVGRTRARGRATSVERLPRLGLARGTKGCRRSALIQVEPGRHSPVGPLGSATRTVISWCSIASIGSLEGEPRLEAARESDDAPLDGQPDELAGGRGYVGGQLRGVPPSSARNPTLSVWRR